MALACCASGTRLRGCVTNCPGCQSFQVDSEEAQRPRQRPQAMNGVRFFVLFLVSSTCIADGTGGRMSCVNVKGYGSQVEDLVSMTGSFPKPELKKGDKSMLVKVLAVSLAPGDIRVMSGKTSLVQAPDSMPYVPGGDLCGVVVEVHQNEKEFKNGDHVVAMFDTEGPRGALAEFKKVKTSHAAIKPASIPAELACALPSSALSAMIACEKYVRKGDRVLVLGGSGGVGCHLVQMLKPLGASFVVCTSTQDKLLRQLGADRVVDYRTQHWWELPEFTEQPFDLIFDLWGTKQPWEAAVASPAMKSRKEGGRFITLVGDIQEPVVQHWWHIASLIFQLFSQQFVTWMWPRRYPLWLYHIGLEPGNGNLARLLRMVEEGRLKPVIDSRGPFRFDVTGVTAAMKLQQSRHAHGKVVISVSAEGRIVK